MKLNSFSHVHKTIRLLCFQLEQLTGLKLMTNLSENFNTINFSNGLSYIVVDFKHEMFKVLSIKLDKDQWNTLKDIMSWCSWLNTGLEYEKRRKKSTNVTNMLQNRKTIDKTKKIG